MQHKSQPRTPYDRLGGKEGVHQLANRFYDIMETDPQAKALYAIHPQPLDNIRRVFSMYLAMWLGGPNEYEAERGHPRLRARHLPFPVTPDLKAQWMYCMRKAMAEHTTDIALANELLAALDQLADHMINRDN